MNHPRPFLRRAWESLDGPWSFALSDADDPGGVRFDRTITVPFAPETPASGIGEPWIPRCWYRRQSASSSDGGPVRLHFGAVDRIARVWADGELVAEHQGGYSPFSCAVRDDAEIVVCVDDDPTDLEAPRGKQDWQREPHSIWYPRTSGIWRTVWWERVGSRSIVDVRWRSDAAAAA